MPVRILGRALAFPPVEDAEDGLLAVGGDLSPERLILAYGSGIFPWYGDGQPILWHSPDPRCVIPTTRVHVGRSLRRVVAKGGYEIRFDTEFARVVAACKSTPRPGQDGTWITSDMERAYVRLFEEGYGHSIETWQGGKLVGGLYGISLGRIFFGESMFSWQPNASKVALVHLAEPLARWDFPLIDAQVPTPNTLALGAEEWPRARFLEVLARELSFPTRRGRWTLAESREGP